MSHKQKMNYLEAIKVISDYLYDFSERPLNTVGRDQQASEILEDLNRAGFRIDKPITKEEELIIDWKLMKNIYPVTIFHTRYNGAYEGGIFVALQERYEEIPKEATGSGDTCMTFWELYEKPYGKAPTPNEALYDLLIKLQLNNLPLHP